jgi:hypothetical protein
VISLRQCLADCSKRRHLHMSFLGERLRWPGMSEDHTLISIVVDDAAIPSRAAVLPGSSDATSQSVAARRASLVSYSLSGMRYGASMVRVRFHVGIACNHHMFSTLVRHAAWVPRRIPHDVDRGFTQSFSIPSRFRSALSKAQSELGLLMAAIMV